jgi:hypothetical protein
MGLRMLLPGDLILLQVDQVEPSLAFIEQFVAANRIPTTPNRAHTTGTTVQPEKRPARLGTQIA